MKPDILKIKEKKDPLKTEMRRFIEAMLADGKTKEDILAEVPHWDQKTVLLIIGQATQQKRPDRYYTSVREPLMSDRFEK
ncbi:MAG: hypothetical protein KJ709_02170 [Nanoarchaeota archaeon]|nr:hypothetical protein [Nanoarchaeota archaeon]